ncbi:MAG: [FeFe] hydrogenase H-cluster radical SAM maturase HydE [Clostridia bacterium]
MKDLIDRLEQDHSLSPEEFIALIDGRSPDVSSYLFERARSVRRRYYGNAVYIRGLIEFTNICRNDCYYCGIRRSNHFASRYRLTKDEILDCCRAGYQLGFRTFVLQGGEDPYFTDSLLCDIIAAIRQTYPDCAITLSIGEKSHASYAAYFNAGANRYLLRHETADPAHYGQLHPPTMSWEKRIQCLWDLRQIGYQVGTGFMVGSPGQTSHHLARDLQFISQLQPDMVGIGPFIAHHDTPFAGEASGTVELTLFLLGLLRLMLPYALLPATTALGTLDPSGREKGVLAGANVVMPNLPAVRQNNAYDNKLHRKEAAESRHL